MGKEVFASKSEKKSTGKDCVCVCFSSSAPLQLLNSSLTSKALDSQVDLALQVLALLSGDSWEKVHWGEGHELSILFSRFMQSIVERNKFVFL